ncbi:glycosyltransferase family 25 protein [Pluralibacter gergoviae]
MIPILVVSMETDIERRQSISQKFEAYNIEFTYIDAVVGKSLSENILKSIDVSNAVERKKRHVSLGEIGCTLSHVKAFNYMIEKSIPYCLILEDDAIFDERLAHFVSSFNPRLLTGLNNDILILGGQNGIDKSQWISKSFFSTLNIGGVIFSKTIKSHKYIFRTCCYVISLDVAKKLHSISQKEFYIADEWEYLKSINAINDIYISDIVDHPLDLTMSHIEHERVESINTYTTERNTKSLNISHFHHLLIFKNIKRLLLVARTFLRRFLF